MTEWLRGEGLDIGRSGTPRKRGRVIALVVVVGVVVLALVVTVVGAVYSRSLSPPEVVSLQEQPDVSLRGTVAFYADGCVRIIAASGVGSREVLCLDEGDGNGPQLAWRDDGRLEITTFDWPVGGDLEAGSQTLVDIMTGEIEEVAAGDLPDTPDRTEVPAVGPDGAVVTATREVSGWPVQRSRLTLTIDEGGQRRTLMSASADPDYNVALGGDPVWSPTGDFVVFIDRRLLVVTTGADPQTRMLVENPFGIGSWASAGIRTFAVTDAEFPAEAG